MRRKEKTHLERAYRYSIRKTSLGVGAVVVGAFLFANTPHIVLADQVELGTEKQVELESSSTVDVSSENTLLTEQPTTDDLIEDQASVIGRMEFAVSEEANSNTANQDTTVNLVEGKAATAQASGVEPGTQYSPNLAFDGDATSRFSSQHMKTATDTTNQTEQWLSVDLGAKAKVERVEVDFYRKVYATDYVVETSANRTDWQEIASSQNLQASNTTQNPKDVIQFEAARDVERYLRLRFKKLNTFAAGHAVSVNEVRILGQFLNQATTNQSGTTQPTTLPQAGGSPTSTLTVSNISLNRPATSSGLEAGTGTTAEGAFDNNPNTRYAAADMKNGTSVSTPQQSQWLQVDLGTQAKISSIEVDYYLRVYATDYKILTSATGQDGSWRELYHNTQLAPDAQKSNPTDKMEFSTPLTSERYLRFHFDKVNYFAGGKAVSIKDIRVNGQLLGTISTPINPATKLEQASLAVRDGRVVLTNIEADDEYSYEVIGSANQYVVDNSGVVSNYVLNDLDVKMVVAARRNDTGELVSTAKQNKTIRISSNHQENVSGQNQKPTIALEIQEFLAGEGKLKLQSSDKFYIASDYKKQGELFNKDLETILGFGLGTGTESDAKVLFKLTQDDPYNLKEEGYLMRVGDKIEVFANNAKAFNYAAVTIAQMLQADGEITKGVYRDYPTYAIRGMLLDVARIPMRLDFVQEVSRLFRWYKLNELHLHINDTQWPPGSRADLEGWRKTEAAHRLESQAFPSLHLSDFKHDRYEGEYDFYREIYKNPTYSLDAFRIFQADSHAAGVNILAEIDTPGHSAAYTLYAIDNPDKIEYLGKEINYPGDYELLSINETNHPERTQAAKRFITDLLNSYLDNDVFTYGHIHLGVDEYWKPDGNKESFRTYMNELNELAKSKGKTVRTWGALTKFDGRTPVSKDIIFDEWAQYESVTMDRINEGYKVVNVPQPFTYVTPGRNHKDIINEQYVYDYWRPNVFNLDMQDASKRAALEGEPLLLGAKGAMWGDEHAEGIEESDLYHRLEKSLAMIGFKTWNPTSQRSFIDYQKAIEATRLKDNYLPLASHSEVLVHIDAKHIENEKIIDLSTNGHDVQVQGNLEVVEQEGEKWLKFDGSNHLITDIETIGLPYTLEMTFKPTDVDQGSLLLSEDGAIYLNKKGRNQAGQVQEGLMFNRYFYSQHIRPKLEVGQEYKLTLAGTRQVLSVYLNNEKIATFSHDVSSSVGTGTDKNFRTSFNLPFKEIAKGFKGYIKDIKVYNRTSATDEVATDDLSKVNIALHKPVYDYRHNSNFWNQEIRPYYKLRVTDGDVDASEGRWNSSNHDRDFFIIDLEKTQSFSSLQIIFDPQRLATAFKVLASDDMENFREIHTVSNNSQADLSISLSPQTARYIKFESVNRQAGKNEIAVKELRVFQDLARTEKASLAREFAEKKVELTSADWLLINNVLENKYASKEQIQAAKARLSALTSKSSVEEKLIHEEPVNQPIDKTDDNQNKPTNQPETPLPMIQEELLAQLVNKVNALPATEENAESKAILADALATIELIRQSPTKESINAINEWIETALATFNETPQSENDKTESEVSDKGNSSEQSVEAPVDKPIDQPVDSSADNPVEAPVDKPIDQPVDSSADNSADNSVEAPADKPIDQPVDSSGDNPVEVPADKPNDQPVDSSGDNPVDASSDTLSDKPIEKPADTSVDKPVETPTDNSVDQPVDSPVEKPTNQSIIEEIREFKDSKTGLRVELATEERKSIVALKVELLEAGGSNTPTALLGQDFDLYDIQLLDQNNKEVETSQEVLVVIPVDLGKQVETLVYLPTLEQSQVLDFTPTVIKNDNGQEIPAIAFKTKHFSYYAIVYKEVSVHGEGVQAPELPVGELAPVETEVVTAKGESVKYHLPELDLDTIAQYHAISNTQSDSTSDKSTGTILPKTGDQTPDFTLTGLTMLGFLALALQKRKENN
ncbi:family 20 glycosylhydrolase [Streptococcus suis]|nr:family 20 glycosylhydrolase [Streptococcus suis]NQJ77216.1 family 20 glycosylhydrolase [Streptococcus suis]